MKSVCCLEVATVVLRWVYPEVAEALECMQQGGLSRVMKEYH